MTVVDMRNFFTDCKVKLIEISDTKIYYAEEKTEEGHDSLFLLEYDRVTQTERIVANYILSNAAYQRHYFAFEDEIIMVMEKRENLAWILRIDKHTGAEKNLAQIYFIGNLEDCKALDSSHILFYTTANQEHQKLFAEYEKLTGFPQIAYLYDLTTETYHYVKDSRICNVASSQILSYEKEGESWLMVLQPYGTELEKELYYHSRDSVGGEVYDQVWTCSLEHFFQGVEAGEELEMTLLFCADTNGLVRYAGMDGDNLYFRAKYFPNEDQRICAINKNTWEKDVAVMLNLQENEAEANFLIDTTNGQVYRVREQEDEIEIKGILNSKVRGKYTRELGDFIACVEDRFLIARYIMSDDRDSFEFNSIFDVETHQQQSYESRCAVRNNTVVLY